MTGVRSVGFPSGVGIGIKLFDGTDSIGAFVAAPVGGLIWGLGALTLRLGVQWTMAKVKGHRFDAFDRPPPPPPSFFTGGEGSSEDERDTVTAIEASPSLKGKFF